MAANLQTWTLGPQQGLNQRGYALASENTLLEAENLNFLSDACVSMRNAFTEEDLTGSGLTGEILWLGRHVTNAGVEELWAAASNSGTVACARKVSGVWSSVTLTDTPAVGSLSRMHSVTFNGKLFLAYDSAVNRLHVWDGTSVRRVGLTASGVGSAANTGAGAYAATARYYRFAQRIKSGATVVCQSELSSAISFTPSGAGSAVRVTGPAAVDSATHWVLYGLIGSSGDTYSLYEELAETAIGATYDDSTAPASYNGSAPPVSGTNIPPPSATCLATDGNRLIMAGAWETTAGAGETDPANNRVWFSRALNETDLGDDEVVPNGLYINIGDAGPVTALGTVYTEVYAFKSGSTHKLVPTQDPDAPYSRVLVSENFGAIGQRCLTNGETEAGYGALYFADDHALYRLAYGAVVPFSENVGRDMRAQPMTADGSLVAYDPYRRVIVTQISNASPGVVGSYSAFATDAVKQRWTGLSLGGLTSGWTLGSSTLASTTILAGGNATIRASVIALGSDSTLRLFVAGKTSAGAASLRSWGKRNVLDGTTAFTTKIRARKIFGPGKTATAYAPLLYYRNPQGSTSGTLTCTVSYVKNYNDETLSQSFTLDTTADDNGITLKTKKLESLEQFGDIDALDCTVELVYSGTAFDSVPTPTIDAIVIPYKETQRL